MIFFLNTDLGRLNSENVLRRTERRRFVLPIFNWPLVEIINC